jgi:hypothetical protein
MAWTTPGTAVAGDVLTASLWNTNVRDNLNSVGAILVATSTFTASATIQITSCFSSSYQNYLIVGEYVHTVTNNGIYFNMLSATTPATGANYGNTAIEANAGGGPTRIYTSAQTKARIAYATNAGAGRAGFTATIYAPNVATPTNVTSVTNAGSQYFQSIGATHIVSTSYDGIQFTLDSDTLTGAIRVYGLINS